MMLGQSVLVSKLCGFSVLCVEAPSHQASCWKERPRQIEELWHFTCPWEELCVVLRQEWMELEWVRQWLGRSSLLYSFLGLGRVITGDLKPVPLGE